MVKALMTLLSAGFIKPSTTIVKPFAKFRLRAKALVIVKVRVELFQLNKGDPYAGEIVTVGLVAGLRT
jgi:hypothetical protein